MEDLPGRKCLLQHLNYSAVPHRVVALLDSGAGDMTSNSGLAGTATYFSIFAALALVYCF